MPSEEFADRALVGSLIENRFILQSVLGRGGISTVYLAKHNRVDLTVAVKILHTHFSNTTESIERFKREAIIINALNHHNIVHMISHGVLSGEVHKSSWYEDQNNDAANIKEQDTIKLKSPRPYLVLEHLKGCGLDDVLDREIRIKEVKALEIVKAIVEGLAFAHDLGIVHRDIKPSNVMLVDQLSDHDAAFIKGESESVSVNVKLLDFGIAKCQSLHDDKYNDSDNDKVSQKLTQPGYIFGSPLYMSPEQCMGADLDARSDIYSLGCMFYEMLTGSPPLRGSNAMHTFAMHLYEMPPLFQKLKDAPQVSKDLEEIIFTCLTKKPEERFASAQQLGVALNSIRLAHS